MYCIVRKSLLPLSLVWLFFFAINVRAQIRDSLEGEKKFTPNVIFLNFGGYGLFLGFEYERFLNDHLSVSGGLSIPLIQPHLNVCYSLWIKSHRLYAGVNVTTIIFPWDGRGFDLYSGIKLGYTYQPRDGGFSFGINIIQWFVRYQSKFDSWRFAPLSAPANLVFPRIGISIGYTF